MKKRLFFLAISTVLISNCTPEETLIEEQKELNKTNEIKQPLQNRLEQNRIDPVKDCPQNDRNCNGIDDSQE